MIFSTSLEIKARRRREAFTMVEIALAIGVIAFALVAIIGILPRGMTVQKNNREDTAVAQDARYFIDAIRSGAVVTNVTGNFGHSMDFLSNYVLAIADYGYTNTGNPLLSSNIVLTPGDLTPNYAGAEILGLISTPNSPAYDSNHYSFTRLVVRSLNSSAVEQGTNSALTAFTYQLDIEIFPYNKFAYDTTNFSAYVGGDYNLRSNRWLVTSPGADGITSAGALTYNLYDVRLRFRWPVINWQSPTKYSLGDGQQIYRTLIGSQVVEGTLPGKGAGSTPLWYFQPQTFTNQTPFPL